MYDPTKPYKKQVLELIEKTWNTPFVSIEADTYSVITKKFSHPEVDHTDGIGTKGIYHWQERSFKNAVLDALAMNLNDLALVRAAPYKLQNHILIPKDDKEAILEIIEALSTECQNRNIAITGGETSIHNNMEGMDIGITVSGFIKTKKPNRFKVGDILIGIKSNGLHSNGFTKVREIFQQEFRPEFIEPTKIYLNKILELAKQVDIHGMMHITGGAFTKLKDLLGNADAEIKRVSALAPQSIFKELHQRGISDEEMYKTFNCGIGFIFSVSPEDIEKIILYPDMEVIGKVAPGRGMVRIESIFSSGEITF